MKIAIQNTELGKRGGINTYSTRLNKYLNGVDGIESFQFANTLREDADVVCIQYEPGCYPPQMLNQSLNMFEQPIVVIAHHTLYLNNFYPLMDGMIIHDKGQIVGEEPWNYCTIPHPSLVFKEKDKSKLRKKYNLPKDKKIIGTMGFICGTGKLLPTLVKHILENIKDDEFLYLMTSFWKGGDMGRLGQIKAVVKELGKEDNFRIDPDFIVDEEILNEKMQCCDLLYSWNNMPKNSPGSQSGSAADMYGSRVKLIVKDGPHYSFIGKQDKVVVGRESAKDFAEDVLKVLRKDNLDDVQDPTWLSWEEQIKKYIEYFEEAVE